MFEVHGVASQNDAKRDSASLIDCAISLLPHTDDGVDFFKLGDLIGGFISDSLVKTKESGPGGGPPREKVLTRSDFFSGLKDGAVGFISKNPSTALLLSGLLRHPYVAIRFQKFFGGLKGE